jgi:hypothetical protein
MSLSEESGFLSLYIIACHHEIFRAATAEINSLNYETRLVEYLPPSFE